MYVCMYVLLCIDRLISYFYMIAYTYCYLSYFYTHQLVLVPSHNMQDINFIFAT